MRARVSNPIRLPASCSTERADETLAALLDRRRRDVSVAIDASDVTSIGQAVLQILVAARIDTGRRGRDFVILEPSSAFLEAVQTSGFDRHLDLVRE